MNITIEGFTYNEGWGNVTKTSRLGFWVHYVVENDEGAFDGFAKVQHNQWLARWPATLANDRTYTLKVRLLEPVANAQATL